MKQLLSVLTAICIIIFSGCSKDNDTNEEPDSLISKDSVMATIFREVSDVGYSFMDITPIPVEPELYEYAGVDTGFRLAIDAIEKFNEIIEHPGILMGSSLKTTSESKWESQGCEGGDIISECTWIEDHGEYAFKFVEISEPFVSGITDDMYIGGTFEGIHYGNLGNDEYYLISEETTMFNNLQISITTYFPPVGDFSGKIAFTFLYIAGEGRTICSDWGGTHQVINSILSSEIYIQDPVKGNRPVMATTLQWEGGLLTTVVSSYCASYDNLRTTYGSTYNFDEHEGSWCVYDCDEVPTACGSN